MSGQPRKQRLEPGARGSGFQRGAGDIRVQALQERQVGASRVVLSHSSAAAAAAAAATIFVVLLFCSLPPLFRLQISIPSKKCVLREKNGPQK